MGKRGPATLPTALKLLRGKAGHHPLNENEPQFDGEPVPPAKVLEDPDALKIWNEKAPELIQKGVITFQDSNGFAAFCLACALRDRLWQKIKEVGEELAIAKGYMKAYFAADERCLKWGAKYGLTPSDRASIKATPKKDQPKGAKRFFA